MNCLSKKSIDNEENGSAYSTHFNIENKQMHLQDRLLAFAALGTAIKNFTSTEFEHICINAKAHNNWFTPENVREALNGVKRYLEREKLENWVSNYSLEPTVPKTVGLVMAGNIPLVGFHDFLSILVAGHKAQVKPSHQDPFLLPYLTDILLEIAPDFKPKIKFADQLKGIEAIIATGSDNTSRYFKYYFSKYPHIIRKNRTSVGIMTGEESKEELYALGKDIFLYYGLGCRNISKVFVPKGYDFTAFFEAIAPFESIRENHKYVNNYDYNKSIYLVNKVPHQDNGFLLVASSPNLVSPISVLYFEPYDNPDHILHKLNSMADKIQCVVSKEAWFENSLPFGKAQEPELWDYADGVDVMKFLEGV